MDKSGHEEKSDRMRSVDPELVRRIADGEYVIDPHAVAEAMLTRLRGMRALSGVLVARGSDFPPVRGKQH